MADTFPSFPYHLPACETDPKPMSPKNEYSPERERTAYGNSVAPVVFQTLDSEQITLRIEREFILGILYSPHGRPDESLQKFREELSALVLSLDPAHPDREPISQTILSGKADKTLIRQLILSTQPILDRMIMETLGPDSDQIRFDTILCNGVSLDVKEVMRSTAIDLLNDTSFVRTSR